MRWWRVPVAVGVTVLSLVAPARPTAADRGPWDGDDAPPLLGTDVSVGDASRYGATDGWSGSGPCATDAFPEGYPHAMVFSLLTEDASRLEIDVRDDVQGASLCEVSVYREKSSAGTFTDPFDAGERAGHLVGRARGCAAASSCTLRESLGANRRYYIAFWAAPPPRAYLTEPDAAFAFDARVRRDVPLHLSISGERFTDCEGWNEVVDNRSFGVVARIDATGVVRFRKYERSGGDWKLLRTYDRELRSGTASLRFEAPSTGKRKFTARYLGSRTTLADESTRRLVRYVDPAMRRYDGGGIRLSVPWYHQQYRLTCESAALRMAVNYHRPGKIDSDLEALREIGIDARRRSGNRWGDPERAFVGDYDGYMVTTGYGVHSKPVVEAASEFRPCRPALRITGASLSEIAGHVYDGFPVVIWGAHAGSSGRIVKVHWYSWAGRYVTAWSVEHTWVVVGYHGSRANPTSFVVHNPSGGGFDRVSLSAFRSFTAPFDRTGVVVR